MGLRYGLAVLVLMTLASTAGACRTAPIHEIAEGRLRTDGSATPDEAAEAIWRAGRKLGWEVRSVAPGELEGTLRLRHHVAVVRIIHDTQRFSIRYVDSQNLGADGTRIHDRYNHWIRNLTRQIENEPVLLIPPGG